ncbi:MAG: VOC family protein [Candidatus Rokubacteria bacterium]|nr:VOC family protein [Candidatus Rokubacteria bacterium]
MPTNDARVPAPPAHAQPPRGINHLVLNVRDLEVSHRFWTENMGFRCVAELKPVPGRTRPKMRFYSGLDAHGDVTHHDLALAEVPAGDGRGAAGPEPWDLMPRRVGLNHVAITWPDRESWLRQLAFLRRQGVPFLRRVNHGMTHSVYIADPDGHGIEVLYELPREVWAGDIDGAQNFAELLPTDGDEALGDRTDNPVFDGRRAPSPPARASAG